MPIYVSWMNLFCASLRSSLVIIDQMSLSSSVVTSFLSLKACKFMSTWLENLSFSTLSSTHTHHHHHHHHHHCESCVFAFCNNISIFLFSQFILFCDSNPIYLSTLIQYQTANHHHHQNGAKPRMGETSISEPQPTKQQDQPNPLLPNNKSFHPDPRHLRHNPHHRSHDPPLPRKQPSFKSATNRATSAYSSHNGSSSSSTSSVCVGGPTHRWKRGRIYQHDEAFAFDDAAPASAGVSRSACPG